MILARIFALVTAAALGLLLATALVPWSRVLLPAMPGPATPAELPVVVAIEDLAGEPWPWPRLDLTLLLRAVSPYRPAPVGLFLPLDAPDALEPVHDDQLSRALASFESPVLPAVAFREANQGEALELPALPHHGSLRSVRSTASFLAPEKSLRQSAAVFPWKVTPEADGHVQRIPLIFRQGEKAVPSWFLVMYARSVGADLGRSELSGLNLHLRDGQGRRVQTVPLDPRGSVPVDWSRPDPQPEKMEIRTVVLASEQERIGVTPVLALGTMKKKPLIVAATLPEVDPSIDSPWGQKATVEAVLRAWARLSAGPLPVLHPPGWCIVGILALSAWLGLFFPLRNRWRWTAVSAVPLLIFSAGWAAARWGGYSGAVPLALGSGLALFLSAPLLRWLENGHVR